MPRDPVLTRDAVRDVDRLAVDRYRIPSIVLMENAARGLADYVLARTKRTPRRPIVVVCGPGNNGGDGLAAARFLTNVGRKVHVVLLTGEVTTEDAGVNLAIVRALGLPVASLHADPAALGSLLRRGAGTVVECLFGTGLTRPLTGAAADAVATIQAARSRGWRVIAADLPAGLDADTGRPLGPCVRADLTVTFAALKPGLLTPSARRFTGRVVVAPIGVPDSLIRELAERR